MARPAAEHCLRGAFPALVGWWSMAEFGRIPYISYFPPHGLVPDGNHRRHEVARQLVRRVVGAGLHNIHRRVSKELTLEYEIFSLRIPEESIRGFRSA